MIDPTSESLMKNAEATSRLETERQDIEYDSNKASVEPQIDEKLLPVSPIETNKNEIPREQVTEEVEYDFFKVPANLQDAKKHGRVKRVFYAGSSAKSSFNESKICLCCNLREGEPIPLNAGLKSVYHLGSGYPLYFKFIKYAIGMLVSMLIVSGLYNLISNVAEGDCSSQKTGEKFENVYCVKGYILSFSLPNKREDKELLTAQLVLNLLTVIVIMVFFHFLRYQLRKLNVEADVQTLTASDYTIELRNIPSTATNEEIVNWILKLDSRLRPQDIIRVHKTYAISKLLKILNEKSAKQSKEEFQNMNKIERCPIVYVTFRTSQQVEEFVKDLKTKKPISERFTAWILSEGSHATCDFEGDQVKIARAPEPTDILWENLEYSNVKNTKAWILSNGLIFALMVISFGIIFVVNWGQGKAVEEYGKESSVVQGLSIICSLVIMMTNFVLSKTIKYFTKYEKNLTYTHYLRGVTKKLTIALFLNTALTNLLAEIILIDQDDSLDDRIQNLNFYGKGGLLENMYWVFITNAILSPLITLFDPSYFFRRLKQFLLERNEQHGIRNNLNQLQANTLYEGSIMDMPIKYANRIKIMLLASFYAPALPFSIIYTIIGLVIWFWVDKFLMLKRMVLSRAISKDLTDTAVEYLEWAACTFAVGNIIYVSTLKNSEGELAFTDTGRSLIWITLGISLIHIYLPMEILNKKFLKIKNKDSVAVDFDEAELKFDTDYDIEDPLTHAVALRRRKQLQQPSNNNNTVSDASGVQLLKKGVADNVIQFLNFEDLNLMKSPAGAKEGRNQEDVLDFRFLQAYARKAKANEQNMDHDEADGEKRAENIFGLLFPALKKGETTTEVNKDLENQSPENQPGKIYPVSENV